MDEILNSRSLNGVRFRMAKPQGYYTEDVENFLDNEVRNSIATYELKVSDQEKEIVILSNKIDELTSKISELEIKVNFNDASGNAEQDAVLVATLERNESLEKQVQALQADLAEKEAFINQLNSYIDEIQPYVEAAVNGTVIESAEEDNVSEEVENDDNSAENVEEPEEIENNDNSAEVDPLIEEEEEEEEEEPQPILEEEEDDNELEVDPEALRIAMENAQPKKSYINNNVQDETAEEPENVVEEKIVDTFFEMDDDLEVDEEALRKALAESDGDDEITTSYR